ncbi:hypothetical protein [Corynebacterium rouxii]|uniref:Uncharacterized protein n=1 Tax=Corynebacterium rouxii TaxID=2719119 RepID=A0A6I8MH11_9CORY|nr:hypothetical protein [Corynebacterium rouxii]VZH85332.1 hypothetical protein FRC0190_01298 [Corynebacterium rouxii]
MTSWKRRLAVIALLADNHISLSPVLVDAVAGLLKSLEKTPSHQPDLIKNRTIHSLERAQK